MFRMLFAFCAAFTVATGSMAEAPKKAGSIVVPGGAVYEDDDASDQALNMSGLECFSADLCLMASDELQGVHLLKISRGGATPSLSFASSLRLQAPDDAFKAAQGIEKEKDFRETDFEAVARTEDTVFVFGSHSFKRKKGTNNPGSHVVAMISIADLTKGGQPLTDGAEVATRWVSLDALFSRPGLSEGDLLVQAAGQQLQCGGINIEAATTLGDRVYVGLRAPVLGIDGTNPAALVVSFPVAALTSGDFSGAKPHVLPTDRPFLGIRAMETVGDAVLVVTGDAGVSDLDHHQIPACGKNIYAEGGDRPFTLRQWTPDKGDMFATGDLHAFSDDDLTGCGDEGCKVEAIAADPGAQNGYFVLYDGSADARYLSGVTLAP